MKIPFLTILIVSFTVIVSSKSVSKDIENDLNVLSEETKHMKEEIDPGEKELLIDQSTSVKEEEKIEVKGEQLKNASNSALGVLKEKKEETNIVKEESKAVEPNPVEGNVAEVFEDNSTGKELSFGNINETKEEIQPVEEKREAVKQNSNEDNFAEKEKKLSEEDFEEKRAEKDIDNNSSLILGKINQTKDEKNLEEAELEAVKSNYSEDNDTKEEMMLPKEEFEDKNGGKDANLTSSQSLGSINEAKEEIKPMEEEIKLPEEEFEKKHIDYESSTLGEIIEMKEVKNLVGEEIGSVEPNSVEGKVVIEEIKLPKEKHVENDMFLKSSLSLSKINQTNEEKNLVEEKLEAMKSNSVENNVAVKEMKLPKDAKKFVDLASSLKLGEINQTKDETGVIDPISTKNNVAEEETKLSSEEFEEKRVEKDIDIKSSLTLDKVNQTNDERNMVMDELVNVKSNSIEDSPVGEEKKLPEEKVDLNHGEKEIVLAQTINQTKDERNLVEGELEVIKPLFVDVAEKDFKGEQPVKEMEIAQFLRLGNIKETKEEKNLTEEELEAAEPIYNAFNVAEEEIKLPEEEFLDNDAGKDVPLLLPLKLGKIKQAEEKNNIEMEAVELNSIEDLVSKEEKNLIEEKLEANPSNTVKKELKHSKEYFEERHAENDMNLGSSLKSGEIKQLKDEKNLMEEEIGEDKSNYFNDYDPVEDVKLGKVLKLAEEHSKLAEEKPKLSEEDLKLMEEYLKLVDEEPNRTEQNPKLGEEEPKLAEEDSKLAEKNLVEEEIGSSESNYVNDFITEDDFKLAEEDSKPWEDELKLAEKYSNLAEEYPNLAIDYPKFAKKNLMKEDIGDAGVSKNEMNFKYNLSGEDKDQIEEPNYIKDYVEAEDSKLLEEESKLGEKDLMLVEDEPKHTEEKSRLSVEKPKLSEEEPKLMEDSRQEEDLRLAEEFSKLTEQDVSKNEMNLKANLSGEDEDQIEEEISLFDSEEMNQLKKGVKPKSRSLLGPRGYGGRGFAVGGCNNQIIVNKPCGPKLRPHKVCKSQLQYDDEFDYFDGGDVNYDGEYADSPSKIPIKSPGLKPIDCKPNKIPIKQLGGYKPSKLLNSLGLKPSKFPGIKPGMPIALQAIGYKPNKPSISWEPEGGNSYPVDGYNPNRPPSILNIGVSDGHIGPPSNYIPSKPSISWEPEGGESYPIDGYIPNKLSTGLDLGGSGYPPSNYIPIKSSTTWVSGDIHKPGRQVLVLKPNDGTIRGVKNPYVLIKRPPRWHYSIGPYGSDIPGNPSNEWNFEDSINHPTAGFTSNTEIFEGPNKDFKLNKPQISWDDKQGYKVNKPLVSWEPNDQRINKLNTISVSREPDAIKTVAFTSYKPNMPSVSWEPANINTNQPSVSWEPSEHEINIPNKSSVILEPENLNTIDYNSFKPNKASVSWEPDGVKTIEYGSFKPNKPSVSWEPDMVNTLVSGSYKPNKASVSWEPNGVKTVEYGSYKPNEPSVSWEPNEANTLVSGSYKPIKPSVSWEPDDHSYKPNKLSVSLETNGHNTNNLNTPSISWEPDGVNTVSSTSYKLNEPSVSWETDGVKTIKYSSFQPNKASVSWEPDGVKTNEYGGYKPINPSVSWEPNGVKTLQYGNYKANIPSVSWEPNGIKMIEYGSYKTNKATVSWEPDGVTTVNTFKSGSYKPNQPLVNWETINHKINIEDGYIPNQTPLSLKIKDTKYKPNKPSLKLSDRRDTKQASHSVSHGSVNKTEKPNTSKTGVEDVMN